MIATIVEWREMGETVLASVLAGVGITFAFSVGIWGASRFADFSRSERPLAAGAAALAASLALAVVGAAVVFGIVVMTSK
ncbi:MAG: hypothetical protein U0R71_07750 [Solirubrobacterales bacterium]